jgi:membrane-bound lytic murein transglycosylase MltF
MDTTLAGFTKYANAKAYAPVVERVANSLGVAPALVMAMIAVESNFNATAYRNEPAIGDASRGLMQILYRTAKAVGYTGTADGLYDPETNVRYGTTYLRDSIRTKRGDVWAGVSAYNNGNGKRATTDTRTCAWRNADGSCGQWFDIKAGQFFNQPYVDKVQAAARLFGYVGTTATAGPGSGPMSLVLVLGIGLALLRHKLT